MSVRIREVGGNVGTMTVMSLVGTSCTRRKEDFNKETVLQRIPDPGPLKRTLRDRSEVLLKISSHGPVCEDQSSLSLRISFVPSNNTTQHNTKPTNQPLGYNTKKSSFVYGLCRRYGPRESLTRSVSDPEASPRVSNET